MVVRGLEEYIEAFRQVIEATWDPICFIEPHPGVGHNGLTWNMGDWQQIQWEVIVEGYLGITNQLDGYLHYYGEGMDGASMRYSEPEAQATHEVCCLPRAGDSLKEMIEGRTITFPTRGLPFGEFVSFVETWYARKPPFDYVLLRDLPYGQDLVFFRDQVCFVLRELDFGDGLKFGHAGGA